MASRLGSPQVARSFPGVDHLSYVLSDTLQYVGVFWEQNLGFLDKFKVFRKWVPFSQKCSLFGASEANCFFSMYGGCLRRKLIFGKKNRRKILSSKSVLKKVD